MTKFIVHVGKIVTTLEADTPTLAVAEVFRRAGDLYDDVLMGAKDVKLAVSEDDGDEDQQEDGE